MSNYYSAIVQHRRARSRVPASFLVLVLFLVIPFFSVRLSALTAAPTDLGQDLKFLRPAAFTPAALADIAPAVTTLPTLVLDLRVASADETSAAALLAALRARPAGKGACLILLSPDTAPALLAALTPAPPGCLTLGRADGACRPDLAVATTAAAEQRALAALANGTPPAALLDTPAVGKPRHDEAELAKDHAAGKKPADLPGDHPPSPAAPVADAKPQPASPEAATTTPPPLVDAVLQRAVQVHRGLVALGKI